MESFEGASPAMIFIMGLMCLFAFLLALTWVGALVSWLMGAEKCGWGCWYNKNHGDHGYCDRRAFHMGEHHGAHSWRSDQQRDLQSK